MLSTYLDDLYVIKNDGKYLVVNSRAGIDSWRFSYETVMRLYAKNQNVIFIDLSFLDPSSSILFNVRKIVRSKLKSKNYEKSIYQRIKDRNIKVIQIRNFYKVLYFFDFSEVLNSFRTDSFFSDLHETAIRSWLAVSLGSTHYSWNAKSKYQLFRVKRSIKWSRKILDRYVSRISINGVLTFNGRFPVDSTLLTWVKDDAVQTILYDGGSLSGDNRNRIQFFETSPHNLAEIRIKIEEYWKAGEIVEREKIAVDYLNAISDGRRSLNSTFKWNTNIQREIVDAKESVVFFASSDWEQGAISKWLPTSGFKSQFEAADALIEICRELGLDLIIKLHPIRKNFKGKKSIKAEESAWSKYSCMSRVRILFQAQGVNPTELLAKSIINVGFRTSLTAQSLYSGKNTAVCAQVPWIKCESNSIYTPDKLSLKLRIEKALNQPGETIDKLPLFKWAYYQAVCGSQINFSEINKSQLILV